MNYKLAKQLKDAGLIIQSLKYTWYWDKKGNLYNSGDRFVGTEKYPEYVICPTLSELIEACGEGLYILEHLMGEEKLKWEARSWHDIPPIKVLAKTPKIAVAKLWLKLNKK